MSDIYYEDPKVWKATTKKMDGNVATARAMAPSCHQEDRNNRVSDIGIHGWNSGYSKAE